MPSSQAALHHTRPDTSLPPLPPPAPPGRPTTPPARAPVTRPSPPPATGGTTAPSWRTPPWPPPPSSSLRCEPSRGGGPCYSGGQLRLVSLCARVKGRCCAGLECELQCWTLDSLGPSACPVSNLLPSRPPHLRNPACRYCPLESAPLNKTATTGCSLLINDTFYDNFSVRSGFATWDTLPWQACTGGCLPCLHSCCGGLSKHNMGLPTCAASSPPPLVQVLQAAGSHFAGLAEAQGQDRLQAGLGGWALRRASQRLAGA